MRSQLRSPHISRSAHRSRCNRAPTCRSSSHAPPAQPLPNASDLPPPDTQQHTPQQPNPNTTAPDDPLGGIAGRARALLCCTLSSAALLLSASSCPALSAESVTIKFPASRNPEIRAAQEVLVQAWGYVRELYVDPTFNKQDWEQRLQDSLAATFQAGSREEALVQVGLMLDSLEDPFTRVLLPGGASEAFAAMTQSKIVSTGLVVGRLGSLEGPLLVSYVVEGSPAAEAGLREGDEVVAVNGRPVWALRGEDARSLQDVLRQDMEVRLKLRRPTGQAPAAPSGARAAARRAAGAAPAQPDLPALPTFSSLDPDPNLMLDLDTATGGDDNAGGTDAGIRYVSAESVSATETAADEPAQVLVTAAGVTRTAAESSPSSSAPPAMSYQLPGSFFDVVLRPAPVEFVPVQYAVLDKGTVGLPSSSSSWGRGGGSNNFRGGGGGPLSTSSTSSTTLTSTNTSPALPLPPPPPPPSSASRVGYIRIVAFTEGVGSQVAAAIRALQTEGCGSWLLDLRGNPGGIVGEGLQVAELLMQPGQVFAVVRDRGGEEHAERLSDRARGLVEGQPLAVLVDRTSASTSELLAGALHDDARALLFGQRTYGKGRTQQVVQLSGGATLLVSTDTYVTPALRPVDRVGLAPDVACRPGPPPAPVSRPARRAAAATVGSFSPSAEAAAATGDGGSEGSNATSSGEGSSSGSGGVGGDEGGGDGGGGGATATQTKVA